MTYSVQTATSIMDIPALVATFAEARGWTRSGETITRPGGGRSFILSAKIYGDSDIHQKFYVTDSADATRQCWTHLPWVNGTASIPIVLAPTKIHLFGNDSPWDEQPWIAVVIECGFNHYRHVYVGNIAKIGNYTGGEIISANVFAYYQAYSGEGGSISYQSTYSQYLLSAQNARSAVAVDAVGGANIVHAENKRPWRVFWGSAGAGAYERLDGSEILGGATDAINSGLVFRGVSDFAGANILVPVNLYVPDSADVKTDVRFRPVGFCPGVRMVNMAGIEPAAVVSIGGKNWKIFPEFCKNSNKSVYYGTSRADGGKGGYYPELETSYLLGLAYPED